MYYEKKNGIESKGFWCYSLIALFLFTISCTSNKENIRFDGFYQKEMKESYSFLRFYKDGTVIATSSSDKMEEILSWFTKENNREIGKFQTDGSSISISTISQYGEYKKVGTVSNNKSLLNLSYVHYDFIEEKSYEGNTEYEFIKMNFPKNSKITKPKENTIMEVVYFNVYRQPRLALLLNKGGQVILKKTFEPIENLNIPLIRYYDIWANKKITVPNEWLLMDVNGNLMRNNSNEPIFLNKFDGKIKSTVEYKYYTHPMRKTLDQRIIYKYDGVISKDIKEAIYIWKM